MSIRDDFFAAKAKGSLWDVAVSIKRGNPLPLDADSIFESYAALEAYAADVLAYPGQVVAVVNADSTGIYYLDQDLAIQPVGVIPTGGSAIDVTEDGVISARVDNVTIKVNDDNNLEAIIPEYIGDDLSIEIAGNKVSMHDFGKAFYKYIPEVKDDEGNTTSEARYDRVEVSETNLWKAGLEPKVVTENGQLVIGWFEPNPTTIEGVNDQVTAVQGTVADLETSVGVPSAEGQEATGLYKEVEDVQEDVENLANEVGTSEDTLGEDVNTLWAHVNDHESRIDVLEAKEDKNTTYTLSGEGLKVILTPSEGDASEFTVDAYSKSEIDTKVKALEDEDAAVREMAEATKERVDTFLDTEGVADVVDSLRDIKAELDKMAETTELVDALALKADKTVVEGIEDRVEVLEAKPFDTYATKSEVEAVDNKFASYTNTEALTTLLAGKQDNLTASVDYATPGDVETAKQAAIDAAASDATSKADAAKQAAIDDAATKYATTGALSTAETTLSGRLDTLEAIDHSVYATKEELAPVTQTANNASTAVTNLEARFDEIVAVGGEPNAINKIQVNGDELAITDKTVNIEVPTTIAELSDWDSVDARITAAKSQADAAASTANKADAQASANAEDIVDHESRIGVLETAKASHLERIVALEAHDEAHTAEFNALNGTVQTNSSDIASLKTGKADTTVTDTLAGRITANENAIKTLNDNTIPGINGEIAKKANSNDVYTKDEIGTITENKTLVEMISEAQSAATYDDTEVRGLIEDNATAIENITKENGAIDTAVAAEAAIARAAEEANAKEIARINGVLVAALDNNEEGLDSIKELADWINTHGTEAAGMAEAISENTEAIDALDERLTTAEGKLTPEAEKNTIVSINLGSEDALTPDSNRNVAIPIALQTTLGVVKSSPEATYNEGTWSGENKIMVAEDGTMEVNKINVNKLVQNDGDYLILDGGSATDAPTE